MSHEKISKLEQEIFGLTVKLNELRKNVPREVIPNYSFKTLDGECSLLDLFGTKDTLLMIHNMGQGCRYCTLWGDGFSPFVEHLETAMSVVLVSKDDPDLQRRFANSRGWRFRTASHGGGDYIKEQLINNESGNHPGAVCYVREGDTVYRTNSCAFGPGDVYCSIWGLLALAGLDSESWTPQYNYWQRPKKLDDGGDNVLD